MMKKEQVNTILRKCLENIDARLHQIGLKDMKLFGELRAISDSLLLMQTALYPDWIDWDNPGQISDAAFEHYGHVIVVMARWLGLGSKEQIIDPGVIMRIEGDVTKSEVKDDVTYFQEVKVHSISIGAGA